jgi:uroporphyrin-3 C-methyltransferase
MSKKSTEENVGQSGTDAKIEAGTDDASVDRENPVGQALDDSPEASVDGLNQSDLGNDRNAARQRSGGGLVAAFALLLALAAAGFSAWQAYESRRVAAELELELARKLAEIETIGSDSRRLSTGARDVARDVEARLGQIEDRLVGIQNQRLAMDSLYQELSLSRDEWTLAEVEQILLAASQQLQLASNVKAALIALEAADARLARSDRPQLTQLRRVVAEDIERLKASPFVDVTGIGLKLERIIASIDEMPLAIETRPVVVADVRSDSTTGGWRLMLAEVWTDLRSLVRIERVESPSGPLLPPDQAFFLRENVKLRLLGARLALLARDEISYKADLAAATEWFTLYYDATATSVTSAVEALDQLAQSDIRIELPNVGASLDAVRNYRLARERAGN